MILAALGVIWLALRGNPHGPWFYSTAGALCAILVSILILAFLVGLRLRQSVAATSDGMAQDNLDQYSVPRGRLRIQNAEYSIPGNAGLDVKEKLESMILDDKLVLGAVPYNYIFYPDPFPGSPKQLQIDFSHGLGNFSVTVPENTKITLPFPYDIFKF
jgi:hypothetical protein